MKTLSVAVEALATVMKNANRNHPLFGAAGALVALVFASACGQLPAKPAGAAAEAAPAPPEMANVAPRPELPGLELEPALLYELMVAEVAMQRGALDTAAEAFSEAAAKTRDYRLAERATRVALRAKDYDRAFESARLWAELRPDAAAPLEAVAVMLVEQGRLSEAETKLKSLLRRPGGNQSQVYRRVADLLSRQNNQDGALDLMDRLVEISPDDAVAHYAKAYLADRLERRELVLPALDRALRLRPGWEDAALAKLAHLIAYRTETVQVADFVDQFLAQNADANKVRMHYARYLVDRQQTEPALAQFATVVERDPSNADASFAAGLLAIQLEQLDKARYFLTQNLKLRPTNDQVRLYLGQVAVEQDRFDEAEKLFRDITDEDYFIDAQMQLGNLLAKRDGTEPALRHLRGITPRSEDEYVRLVLSQEQVLREATELQEAKLVLDGAIDRYPENGELLYARGLVAAQLELLEVHEKDMRKLLALDPKNAHALNALGYTLADSTERVEEAYELIRQALAIRPDDPFILDSMGWVHYRMGNYELAIQYLQQALAKRQDAEIAAHLGEVLWVTGDTSRARSIWDAALEQHPKNEVLLRTIKKLTE